MHVKVGETVRLSITAEDKEHWRPHQARRRGLRSRHARGFEIAANEDRQFKSMKPQQQSIHARTPGTYEF